jgi:hypothetical protein
MAMAGGDDKALAELERRYDGPIPELLRRGLLPDLPLLEAERQADFFAGLIRLQISVLRHYRTAGLASSRLARDLRLYRRRRAWWRRRARASSMFRRSAGDAP